MWKDVINLISETETTNTIGDLVKTRTPRTVFANKKSVRQSEFYQAFAQGLQAQIMFEVRISDYGDEMLIQYNDIELEIIRTYEKNSEIIELICKGVD